MVKKCSLIHKEVIDIFHEKIYIPTIEKLSFNISGVMILGSMECRKTRHDFSMIIHLKQYKV